MINTNGYTPSKRYIHLISYTLIVCLLITGCGKVKSSPSQSSPFIMNEEIAVTNPEMRSFNQTLGQIDNEKQASDAAHQFAEYVATRFKESDRPITSQSGKKISQVETFKQLLKVDELGKKEWLARQKIKDGFTTQTQNPELSTPDDLVKEINRSDSPIQTNESELLEIQKGVRQSLPNLAVNDQSTAMTPLESSVIAWTYISGDDGQMGASSLEALDFEHIQEKMGETSSDIKSQWLFSIPWFWNVILYTVLFCSVDRAISTITKRDVFGNKVSDREEKTMCIKHKKGRRTVYKEQKVVTQYNYYTYQDLEQSLASEGGHFWFDSSAPPYQDIAMLPSQPNRSSDVYIASFDPEEPVSGYSLFWHPMTLDGTLEIGDIIFYRGPGIASRTVKYISSWTHTAMVYNASQGLTLESTFTGVDIYSAKISWDYGLSWAVKRVKGLSLAERTHLIHTAYSKWGNREMKYFPEMTKEYSPPKLFTQTWADKTTESSMYCFKLVYKTYMQAGIDLDSNRTRLRPFLSPSLSEKDYDDYGNLVDNAFIGVTGDDIYYSKHLEKDKFNYGLKYLSHPILTTRPK